MDGCISMHNVLNVFNLSLNLHKHYLDLVTSFCYLHVWQCKGDNKVKYKTGVVNDPQGQPTARTAVKICFVSLDFEKWGQMDRRTTRVKTVITSGHVWVGLVDQKVVEN